MKLKLYGRLSFPQIWRPTVVRKADGTDSDGKPTYSGNLLLAANDGQADKVYDVIEAVSVEKWGAKSKIVLGELYARDRVCIHNGDYKADYDGYAGMFFITARSDARPLIVDRDGRTVLTEQTGRPYGGCFVYMLIDIYAQDNQWGKRVNSTLKGLQFAGDGDAFAAGPPATPEDFDDLSVAESSELA